MPRSTPTVQNGVLSQDKTPFADTTIGSGTTVSTTTLKERFYGHAGKRNSFPCKADF